MRALRFSGEGSRKSRDCGCYSCRSTRRVTETCVEKRLSNSCVEQGKGRGRRGGGGGKQGHFETAGCRLLIGRGERLSVPAMQLSSLHSVHPGRNFLCCLIYCCCQWSLLRVLVRSSNHSIKTIPAPAEFYTKRLKTLSLFPARSLMMISYHAWVEEGGGWWL